MTTGTRATDLHTHTSASDGDHSPEELVAAAARAGLRTIAVTDHDTTDGVAEATAAGLAHDVEVVPGIEFSAAWPGGQCHLLGLFVDPCCPVLESLLAGIRRARDERNRAMLESLAQLGLPLDEARLHQVARGRVVARPHFARLLVDSGAADSVADAFDRYLGTGRPAYVPRAELRPGQAVEAIHRAGGVALLAHPTRIANDPGARARAIEALVAGGIDGLEARYSTHSAAETREMLDIAERLGLVTSGGSDFHGPSVKPGIMLGSVELGEACPNEVVDALRERASRYRPAPP